MKSAIRRIVGIPASLRARKSGFGARDAVLFFAVSCLGGLSALVIAEPWSRSVSSLEAITINGAEIRTGEPRPEALLKMARARLLSSVTLLGPDFSYSAKWSTLGADASLQAVGELLTELGKNDSPAVRFFHSKRDEESASIELPLSFGSAGAVESLVAIKDTIDREAQDAKLELKTGEIVEEKDGLSLDIYGTLSRLSHAIVAGEDKVEMVVRTVPAEVTRDKLREIDVSSVLGFFETPYSQMRKDEDRTHNVGLGAKRLDGQVILPGEVFSLNDVLGERNEARGFRYAPVIEGGVLVEGMGGGTCQVASTLYAAAFFAGLIVTERQTHSRPSSYIKLGLDATVSYPDLDLKLKNPFEFPIAVHFELKEGILRAEIRGKYRPYTVTFLRKVIKEQPFPVRILDDPNLPAGKEVVTQLGIPGYTVRRYQIIEANKTSYRFQTVDKYPPTVQFVHRGTASSGAAIDPEKVPKPDTHKPYLAVNYLRMVQGQGGLWYEKSHD